MFNLVELGPGRATLIKDALRASRLVPGFHDALEVVLVESNTTLIKKQKEALFDITTKLRWVSSFKEATQKPIPTIVIANEFIDTFPVRQFVHDNDSWFERTVNIDKNGALQFGRMSEKTIDPATHIGTGPDLSGRCPAHPGQRR